MHERKAQMAVTALRYFAKDGAVAGRDLLRHEGSTTGEMVTVFGATPLWCQWRPTMALEMIGQMPGTLSAVRTSVLPGQDGNLSG